MMEAQQITDSYGNTYSVERGSDEIRVSDDDGAVATFFVDGNDHIWRGLKHRHGKGKATLNELELHVAQLFDMVPEDEKGDHSVALVMHQLMTWRERPDLMRMPTTSKVVLTANEDATAEDIASAKRHIAELANSCGCTLTWDGDEAVVTEVTS